MAADTELDRNEAATPHKLSEARKRGQVAKSADVVSAVVFAAAVVWFYALGWSALREQFVFDRMVFSQAGNLIVNPRDLWHVIEAGLIRSASLLLPFFGTVVVAALAANILQTGIVFSAHPVKPDWDRINPVNGLKRVFSLRTLFDAFRACAKLLLLTWVVYESLVSLLPQFYRLAGLPALGQTRFLLADAASLGLKIALALAVIAVIDLAYTRREFAKRLRMSRRELKDEHKHREGDPRIRARLRELRREMLKRTRALRKTRDADVLVTNPTHYAVALSYRHGQMAAPRVLAKGAGTMAAAMRAVAAKHRIPVVQNRTLARALYASTGLDEEIPGTHFPEVARLMVWLMAMRDPSRRMAPADAPGAAG